MAKEQGVSLYFEHFRALKTIRGDSQESEKRLRLEFIRRAIDERLNAKQLKDLVPNESGGSPRKRNYKRPKPGAESGMLRELARTSREWMRRHDESWLGNEEVFDTARTSSNKARLKKLRDDCQAVHEKLDSIAKRAAEIAEKMRPAPESGE